MKVDCEEAGDLRLFRSGDQLRVVNDRLWEKRYQDAKAGGVVGRKGHRRRQCMGRRCTEHVHSN